MKYGNRGKRNILSSPFTLLFAIFLFGFMLRTTINIYKKGSQSEARLQNAQVSLAESQDHLNDISNRVSYLSSDRGMESEIRSKFHVAKDGESVAVIVDKDKASATKEVIVTKESWWHKFLNIIGL